MNKHMICRIGITVGITIVALLIFATFVFNPFNIDIYGLIDQITAPVIGLVAEIILVAVFTGFVVLLNTEVGLKHIDDEGGEVICAVISGIVSAIYLFAYFVIITAVEYTPSNNIIAYVSAILLLIANGVIITSWVAPRAYIHIAKPVCKRIWGGSDE